MNKMRIKLNAPIYLKPNNGDASVEIKPNMDYLISIDTFKSLKLIFSDQIVESEEIELKNKKSLKDSKTLLVWRSGGIGDLLFTFPYLAEIKKRHPFIKITFVCMKKNFPILALSPHIDEIFEEPLILDENILSQDHYVVLDHFIESNKKAEKVNAFLLGEDFFGFKIDHPIDFVSNLKPQLPKLIEGKKIHIAIGLNASVAIRDISHITWWHLLKSLNSDNFRVTLITNQGQNQTVSDLINQTKQFNPSLEMNLLINKPMKEVIDHLLRADVPHMAIGPDSGIVNLLGYHNIPVIGLFGPFDSSLRLKYYEFAIGIDIKSGCNYGVDELDCCYEHGNGSCSLAKVKNEVLSPCLLNFDGSVIVPGIYKLLKEAYQWGN